MAIKCPFREMRPCDKDCAIYAGQDNVNKCGIRSIQEIIAHMSQLEAAIGQVVKNLGEKTLS